MADTNLYTGGAGGVGGMWVNGGSGGTGSPGPYSTPFGGYGSDNSTTFFNSWYPTSPTTAACDGRNYGEDGRPGHLMDDGGCKWGTTGGDGWGGGGGGFDEVQAAGAGGNGANGFVRLKFQCTADAPGGGGSAFGGSGGNNGGPSSITPP